MPTTLPEVREFLALKRIALVGVSRDPKEFSRYVLKEMRNKGYDMVAVNPAIQEVEGQPCFARVQDIQPPVEGVLIMTPSKSTERVVRDCAEAGIRRIWMHRSGGDGSVNRQAIEFCHEQEIQVVEGHCPLMFLPHTQFVHRLHGFVLKMVGGYPRNVRAA